MNNLLLFMMLTRAAFGAGERMPEPPPIPRFLAPVPDLDPRVLARAEAGLARHRRAAAPVSFPAMPAMPGHIPAAPVLTEAEKEAVAAAFAPFAMSGTRLTSLPLPSASDGEAPAVAEPVSGPGKPAESTPPAPIDLRGSIVGLELEPLPEGSVLAAVVKSQAEEPTLFARVKRKLLSFQP